MVSYVISTNVSIMMLDVDFLQLLYKIAVLVLVLIDE